MLISIDNSLTKISGIQQSYFASPISVGATSVPTKNIAGFNNNWAVQFGQTGEETAEIMNISGAPAGTTIGFGTSPSHTAGTTLFSHAQDTPMYQIHYDQIVINRSTTGTAGPFSALATVNITPDSPYTSYDDATGATGYAYYVQYYNSVNGDLSGTSSVFIPGGPTYYSLQKIRQRVKDKLYSFGFIRNDDIITDWINEWYEIMQNAAVKVNQNYMLGTAVINFGTSGYGTVTATDFKQAVKFEVSYDAGVTYTPSGETRMQDWSTMDYFNPLDPIHSWFGETTFIVQPPSTGGQVLLTYAQRFTPLINDTDELTNTLKGYTTCCVEYCLGVAYGLDQKDTESQQHMQTYVAMKNDFIAEVVPRDVTREKTINLVEGISGMQEAMDVSGDVVF